MALIDIYCEIGFIKKFYDFVPQIEVGTDNKDVEYWIKLDNFFAQTELAITFDIDKEQFTATLDEETNLGITLTEWLQLHYDDKKHLGFGKNVDGSINTKNAVGCQRLFFLDKPQTFCSQLTDNYGLLFISSENFLENKNIHILFSKDSPEINAKNANWRFLKKYHTCNFIILADKFLCPSDNPYKQNIFIDTMRKLFDSLLPEKLEHCPFNIHIFTEPIIPNYREKMKDEIDQLREYDVIITFHPSIHHDRHLITNYFDMKSGYGFVLTNKEKESGTILDICPLTDINNNYIVETYIKKSVFNQ